MMSKNIIYPVWTLMVLGLMLTPAWAAAPGDLNPENALALSSQSRMLAGGSTAADMLRDPFVLAKSGGGGGGSGDGQGGNSDSNGGDALDGRGPKGGQQSNQQQQLQQHLQIQHQHRHQHQYQEQHDEQHDQQQHHQHQHHNQYRYGQTP